MVIRLGSPQPLAELPRKVSEQTEDGQRRHLDPEDGTGEQPGDNAKVLDTDVQLGRHLTVDGHKNDPNSHGTGDGDDVVFGPVVGYQRSFAQDGKQDGAVHGRTPDPLSAGESVALGPIVEPEEAAADVEDDGVVDGVDDPLAEDTDLEEAVALAEIVELRVAVEQAGRDELIEDTESEGRKDGVEDVVERESPGFVNDFTRKDVLEGVLFQVSF